jgi:hypothetical protein
MPSRPSVSRPGTTSRSPSTSWSPASSPRDLEATSSVYVLDTTCTAPEKTSSTTRVYSARGVPRRGGRLYDSHVHRVEVSTDAALALWPQPPHGRLTWRFRLIPRCSSSPPLARWALAGAGVVLLVLQLPPRDTSLHLCAVVAFGALPLRRSGRPVLVAKRAQRRWPRYRRMRLK